MEQLQRLGEEMYLDYLLCAPLSHSSSVPFTVEGDPEAARMKHEGRAKMKRSNVSEFLPSSGAIIPLLLVCAHPYFIAASEISWSQIQPSAAWSPRVGCQSVVFHGEIWTMGGSPSYLVYSNDIWRSSDGITWTNVTSAAPWAERTGFSAVAHDDKIWILGGVGYPNAGGLGTRRNDVWYSPDGVNWTEATTGAGWNARSNFGTVSFMGKLWIMGGIDSTVARKHDVWASDNGTDWTQTTSAAGWSPRSSLSSISFNNRIWVIGGDNSSVQNAGRFSDVWYSTDGSAWTVATLSAPWGGRSAQAVVSFRGAIWLTGGLVGDYPSSYTSDTWYSTDGQHWSKPASNPAFTARYIHNAVVQGWHMFLLGGQREVGGQGNDVWSSPGVIVHQSEILDFLLGKVDQTYEPTLDINLDGAIDVADLLMATSD